MMRIAALVSLAFVLLWSPLYAQDTRPIRDNVGFTWDAHQMERLVDYLNEIETAPPPPSNIVAAIAPHDDYMYAARVYYPP